MNFLFAIASNPLLYMFAIPKIAGVTQFSSLAKDARFCNNERVRRLLSWLLADLISFQRGHSENIDQFLITLWKFAEEIGPLIVV